MPESDLKRIAGEILPEPIKLVLRPIYQHTFCQYYNVLKLIGKNYYTYNIEGSNYRLYYTAETFESFANLIKSDKITTERVSIDVFNSDEEVDAVIDVGSHYGIYSVLMQKLNPNAQLYCFEPDNYNRQILTEVLNENKINAKIDHRLVFDKTGSVAFFIDETEGSESHSISKADGLTRTEKKSVALSDIINKNGIKRAYVKIDAEGAELSILQDLFTHPPEYLEGVVELHPDKLSKSVDNITQLLREHCCKVEFLADTSPNHPEAESIAHEYNRPMYYFKC